MQGGVDAKWAPSKGVGGWVVVVSTNRTYPQPSCSRWTNARHTAMAATQASRRITAQQLGMVRSSADTGTLWPHTRVAGWWCVVRQGEVGVRVPAGEPTTKNWCQ